MRNAADRSHAERMAAGRATVQAPVIVWVIAFPARSCAVIFSDGGFPADSGGFRHAAR